MVSMFLGVVVLLLVISTIFKIIILISESKYDGKHTFNLAVTPIDKSKKVYLFSFAPDKESLSYLQVALDKPSSFLSRTFAVPIDGKIQFKHADIGERYMLHTTISSQLQYLIFHFPDLSTNLNIVDLIKMYFYSKAIPTSNITIREVEFPLSEPAIDKLSSSFFSDSTILSEKLTIQVINGTGVSGLGNKLARFITNMGGNVIAVGTQEKEAKISEVSCFGEKSYTCNRIHRVLHFPLTQQDTQGIADVIIIIGKDTMRSLPL